MKHRINNRKRIYLSNELFAELQSLKRSNWNKTIKILYYFWKRKHSEWLSSGSGIYSEYFIRNHKINPELVYKNIKKYEIGCNGG